ncbi:MAG: TetR/AcrR family transcriptional regulator [Chloroflexota bacterium]|nr:TetR/AcrR family transcriptional regulator [Chloroflexota bacterium]
MARKPAPPGGDRRQQILEAALDLFSEQGLAGATSKDIAERAEVTHGLIYFYFKTKEDLFKAAFEYALEQALNRLDIAAIAQSDDPPEVALTRLLTRVLDALNAPRVRSMSRLTLHTMAHGDWSEGPLHECKLLVRDTIIYVVDSVRVYLDRQVELGRIRPVNTQVIARFLIGGVLSSARWANAEVSSGLPPSEIAHSITDACVRGLSLPTEAEAPVASVASMTTSD